MWPIFSVGWFWKSWCRSWFRRFTWYGRWRRTPLVLTGLLSLRHTHLSSLALTLASFKQKLLSNAKSTPEAVDVSIFHYPIRFSIAYLVFKLHFYNTCNVKHYRKFIFTFKTFPCCLRRPLLRLRRWNPYLIRPFYYHMYQLYRDSWTAFQISFIYWLYRGLKTISESFPMLPQLIFLLFYLF